MMSVAYLRTYVAYIYICQRQLNFDNLTSPSSKMVGSKRNLLICVSQNQCVVLSSVVKSAGKSTRRTLRSAIEAASRRACPHLQHGPLRHCELTGTPENIII